MYIGNVRQFGAQLIAAGQGRVTAKKLGNTGSRVPSYVGLRLPRSGARAEREVPGDRARGAQEEGDRCEADARADGQGDIPF